MKRRRHTSTVPAVTWKKQNAFAKTWPKALHQCADCALFSPPYNYGKHGAPVFRYKDDADRKSVTKFQNDIVQLFHNLDSAIRPRGIVLMNINFANTIIGKSSPMAIIHLLSAIDAKTPWTLANVLYWDKHTRTPEHFCMQKTSMRVEPIYLFTRKREVTKTTALYYTTKVVSAKPHPKNKNHTYYKSVCGPFSNLIESKRDKDSWPSFPSFHIGMAERILCMYCPPGGTVLDPFMGSGTTAIAAMKTGRSAIGLDVCQDYIDRAKRRVENATVEDTVA